MKKWIFSLLLLGFSSKIWAQGCSLCSLNAEAQGTNGAHGLNNGILYLAAIPLIFVIVVGIIWLKRNHNSEEEAVS